MRTETTAGGHTMTQTQHQPTREEVLEAVAAIRAKSGDHVATATFGDVAEYIASANYDGRIAYSMYGSRMAELRRYVSVGMVKRHLASLVESGDVLAVSGNHWSLRTLRGTSAKWTFYVTPEWRDAAIAKEARQRADVRTVAALEAAQEAVLANHADEVRATYERLLAGTPEVQDRAW